MNGFQSNESRARLVYFLLLLISDLDPLNLLGRNVGLFQCDLESKNWGPNA